MDVDYGEEETKSKEEPRGVSRGNKRRGVGDGCRSQHPSRFADARGANLEDSSPRYLQDINKIINVLCKSALANHLVIRISQAVILHTMMVPITSPWIVAIKEPNK